MVSRSARTGAILFAAFGAMLLLEFLWIQLGPPYFPSARRWADLHPPESRLPLVAGGACAIGLAWAVLRGHRWAWSIVMVWAALGGGAGAIALLVLFLIRTPTALQYVQDHLVESAGGFISLLCLLGSLASLSRREARDCFRQGNYRGGNHGPGNRGAASRPDASAETRLE